MKTLRIIFLLLLLTGLAISSLFGQEPTKLTVVIPYTMPFPCINQNLTGTLTGEVTIYNNHRQSRISGIMIGESDGLEYFLDGINNIASSDNWDEWGQKTITYTWPGNYHIYRNGRLVGTVFFSSHLTVNPNGEVVVDWKHDAYYYTCVGAGRIK